MRAPVGHGIILGGRDELDAAPDLPKEIYGLFGVSPLNKKPERWCLAGSEVPDCRSGARKFVLPALNGLGVPCAVSHEPLRYLNSRPRIVRSLLLRKCLVRRAYIVRTRD